MVKIANLYWPAKIIRKIDGEITEIEVFDELKTRKIVEHIKLKFLRNSKKYLLRGQRHGKRRMQRQSWSWRTKQIILFGFIF